MLGTIFCLASGHVFHRFSHSFRADSHRPTHAFPTLTLQMRKLRVVKRLAHGYTTTHTQVVSGLESDSCLPVSLEFLPIKNSDFSNWVTHTP